MGIEKSNRLERGPWGPGASWRFLIPSVGGPVRSSSGPGTILEGGSRSMRTWGLH